MQAQSSVTSSIVSTPDTNIFAVDNKLDYIVMNSTDKKIRNDFKDLKINIAPNSIKGVLSLEITSQKSWTLLMELKNSVEDVLARARGILSKQTSRELAQSAPQTELTQNSLFKRANSEKNAQDVLQRAAELLASKEARRHEP